MTCSRADAAGSCVRSESVDLETLLTLLAPDRRRQAVLTLLDCERDVSLDELSRRVACRPLESTTCEPPQSLIDRIRISLHHSHLPKLHDAGIVEYDAGRRTVTLTTESAQLERLLDDVQFVKQ
ncbi:DUF7344 domain-containing protein [Halorientalis salina]|uniref:DUF7344 domain-containing protein n=1 Tax=Halorientalis salina TaxID=2932266 RepID=UPI003FD835DB